MCSSIKRISCCTAGSSRERGWLPRMARGCSLSTDTNSSEHSRVHMPLTVSNHEEAALSALHCAVAVCPPAKTLRSRIYSLSRSSRSKTIRRSFCCQLRSWNSSLTNSAVELYCPRNRLKASLVCGSSPCSASASSAASSCLGCS